VAEDDAAVTRFIGRFAEELVDSGMARMPARVWVLLLATDAGRLTAAEIAERLQISPAAVSGAVRYLLTVDLIVRERDPGARKDHYRVRDDSWFTALASRDARLARWSQILAEGAEGLGDGAAGSRVRQTQEFVDFMDRELRLMLDRWRAMRPQT